MLTKLRRRLARPETTPSSTAWRPNVEALEGRDVPSGVSSIASNFLPVPIAGGTDIWFSSEAKVDGLPRDAATTLHVTAQTITFTAKGAAYTIPVPDSTITLDPALKASQSTATFANGAWSVHTSRSNSGEVFLGGVAFPVPAKGLPAGIKNVTWTGTFTADQPDVRVKWNWGAAVYTRFASDLSTLDVKPTNRHFFSADAGTPRDYTRWNIPGATGFGFWNDTGRDSRTAKVHATYVPATLGGSLSGVVYADTNRNGVQDDGDTRFAGLTMTLSGVDANGNMVAETTTTATDGRYTFTHVPAGTFSISVSTPVGYNNGEVRVGSLGAMNTGPDYIEGIILSEDGSGTDYDFGLIPY